MRTILFSLMIIAYSFAALSQDSISADYLGYSNKLTVTNHTDTDLKIFYEAANVTEPVLKIHYLGHSSFVLQFDNDITVVTDYGHYNAWYPAWDSPIYDFGDLVPDIMTYSHFHEDHYDPDRIPDGVDYILTESDSIEIDGLKITPIRVCESNINTDDNTAFLFRYKGLKFLHLGDAQAQIMAIENPDVQIHMSSIIPDSLDLLLMPIEGMQQFAAEAEIFLDLVKPRRFVPMHYWSSDYKQYFLEYLEDQNNSGANYNIIELSNSKYVINEDQEPVTVISLLPSQFSGWIGVNDPEETPVKDILFQNYPNPVNDRTKIKFFLDEDQYVKLVLIDMSCKEITVPVDEYMKRGIHTVSLNCYGLMNGIYFCKLITEGKSSVKKIILNR